MRAKLIVALLGLGCIGSFGGSVNAQTIAFAVAPTYPTGSSPSDAKLADMDGDGDLDLVTADYGYDAPSSVSVIKNVGNARFGPPSTYATDADATALALGDFNKDGRPDAVTTHTGAFGSTVTIFMNDGSGGLVNKQVLNVGASPQDIVTGDFDSDGITDFAVACYYNSVIRVYRSLGNGSFSAYRNVNSSEVWHLAVADMNQDGKLDILGGSYDGFSVYINTGTGFTRKQTVNNYPVGVCGLAAGDLNGDGLPDVAASGRELSVFTNTGQGALSLFGRYQTASNLTGIEIGDMDGNGKKDIVGANYGGNSVSIFYNDAGGFQLRDDWGVGRNPQTVALGDLNKDGRVDIVAPTAA